MNDTPLVSHNTPGQTQGSHDSADVKTTHFHAQRESQDSKQKILVHDAKRVQASKKVEDYGPLHEQVSVQLKNTVSPESKSVKVNDDI